MLQQVGEMHTYMFKINRLEVIYFGLGQRFQMRRNIFPILRSKSRLVHLLPLQELP